MKKYLGTIFLIFGFLEIIVLSAISTFDLSLIHIFALVFAGILSREKIRGQNFFRIIFYIPNILSVVVYLPWSITRKTPLFAFLITEAINTLYIVRKENCSVRLIWSTPS